MANILNLDLNNKIVVVDGKLYSGSVIKRLFRCKSGFGCESFTSGRAIYGEFLVDGERCRISGYDIVRLATEEEIQVYQKEILSLQLILLQILLLKSALR